MNCLEMNLRMNEFKNHALQHEVHKPNSFFSSPTPSPTQNNTLFKVPYFKLF